MGAHGAARYCPAVESLRHPPIGFAHRGGQAHAPANTLAAFANALSMGATGLETDAWLTADGVVVLDHDGLVRSGWRRRPLSRLPRGSLPPSVTSLDELYAACGTGFELSVDLKDVRALGPVLESASAAGGGAPGRLWLCHGSWERLAAWRRDLPNGPHLVNTARIRDMGDGPERRAAQLAEAGIDAVNLHRTEWTGGLTTLFHRFGRLAFGWDAQHERVLRELIGMGIDGVYCDHVDRLAAVLGSPGPGPGRT